jgi:hypothetical protein
VNDLLSIYLIHPAAQGLEFTQPRNRNEYHKQEKNVREEQNVVGACG